VKESSLEQLDGDDGEDEVKEHVDDHDVDDVLERVDDTVEHRLTTQTRSNNVDHHQQQHHHHADFDFMTYFVFLSFTIVSGVL